MKNILIAFVLIFSTQLGNAQNIIDKHFSHFKNSDDFTTISVTGKMFEIVAQIEIDEADEEFKDFKNMISNIESFNMIVGEDLADPLTEYKSALKLVANSHEELMRISTKEEKIIIKVQEANGFVQEVIMIGKVDQNFIAFSLMGQIRMEEIGQVINKVQSSNLDESFEEVFKNKIEDFKVYPNPVSTNGFLTVDIPEDMSQGQITIIDIDGKVVKELAASGTRQSLSIDGLNPGTYVVQINMGDVRMNKKIIVLQ
jgi:ribosomal protein S8